MREKTLNFLEAHQSEQPSTFVEDARWRKENEVWLKWSRGVALAIVDYMQANGLTRADIAAKLGVTTSTLTINMNALEKKGNVVRERSTKDKRIVYVRLTERGRKAFFHHRDFHKKMIKSIVSGISKEERRVLIDCLCRLQEFFESYGED